KILASLESSVDDELCSWMMRSSGGNPFFIATIASHYAATRHRFSVPPTIIDMLTKRMGALSADALQLLRISAVLGKNSTSSRLSGAVSLEPLRLLPAIEELAAARLVAATKDCSAPSH